MLPRRLSAALLAASLATHALAQSVYIDAGSPTHGVPSSSYGAAAGIPGHWNPMTGFTTQALVDTSGAPTSVLASFPICDHGSEDVAQTRGDDDSLLDDFWWTDCHPQGGRLELSGLRAGSYQLFLYPHAGGLGSSFLLSTSAGGTIEGGANGTNFTTAFPGSYVGWPVAVRLVHLPVDGASLELSMWGWGLSGLQLVHLSDGATFCAGDRGACPCGVGAAGAGCPSSFSADGATLRAAGSQQISSDTLVLTASGVSNSVVTLFQGTTAQNVGLGSPFGDGLRCAGGSIVRIASVQASGGVAQYPQSGDLPIFERGGVAPSGGFRAYQVWYRNAASYCTSSVFNLTNGVAIDWRP